MADEDQRITVLKTSAGIPVVVEKMKDSGSAAYTVAVNTGSRDETKDIFGISHLLEHVVFRETETRSSYQMAKEMEAAGGELNAFTSKEITAFYGITIKETADVAREMVADIVAHPKINENDVEMEKKIVLQEISMVRNDPETYIHDLFAQTVWKGHKLSQDEAGEVDIVKKLGSKELREYYENYYKANNFAVFAVGDIDPEETVAWAEENFDNLSGGTVNQRSAPTTYKANYDRIVSKSDHCYIAMGFPSFDACHPDKEVATLLSAILGSGTSSRLFQSVREEKGLVYSIYNSTDQNSDAASMGTYMSATVDNAIEAMETTASTYKKLRDEGLEPGELQRFKNLIKGATVRAMESSSQRMYRLTRNYMLTGKPEPYENRLAAMDKITEEDVMRVAGDILRADRLNLTLYGESNRKLKKFSPDQLDL